MERKLIAAAVSSALVLPMAAQAVEFSVSGQVNRALISVDGTGADNDGDIQHVDANSSNTRFRMVGSEELDSGMTAGVQLEWGALNGKDNGPTIRQANVSLTSAGGKLTIGQASTATDGMAHADLGGPSWLGGATNWCSYAGSGPACPSNDGGRVDVLRYDTPAIGPAAIAFSVGNDDYWDVKLSISGSMGDAGYDIRIGHIGEHNAMVADPGMPAMAAMPGMDAVAGMDAVMGTGAMFMDGRELLVLLANEVEEGDRASSALWNSDGDMIDDTASNSDATAGITGHVGDNDNVLELVRVGGADDDALAESTYRRTVNNAVLEEAVEGTDAVAATPAVAQGMMEDKKGDITTASAGFSFGQGTSVALAWSQNNATDNEYQYIKLDHSYGDGSVGVYYKSGETTGEGDGSLWGVGLGHSLGGGAHAYAGFRQVSQDGKEDVDLILAGMRVTFN